MGSLQLNLSKINISGSDQKTLEIVLRELLDGFRAVCVVIDGDATISGANYASTLDSYSVK